MDRGDWKRAESLLSRAVQPSPGDTDAGVTMPNRRATANLARR